jgi:pimeloyl-ACP methyl ester carboxylesterase
VAAPRGRRQNWAVDLHTWRTQARTLEVRGHRLAWWRDEDFDSRDAPVLLLIHGFPTSSWDWHRAWPDMAARFRLIALDMLGFGLSEKPRRHAYSIAEQAGFHQALLAELGVDRVHVLAHDYGDSVAQELLARSADGEAAAPSSVCFLNGGLIPGRHHPRPIQRLLAGPLGPAVSRLLNESRFRKSFCRVFGPQTRPSDALLRESWELISEGGGHRIAHRLIRYMAERRAMRDRWVGILGTTPVPLCLIDGLLDPVSGSDTVAGFREAAPAAHVVELPEVGHYPQLEDPQAVTNAHRDWLESLDSRSS